MNFGFKGVGGPQVQYEAHMFESQKGRGEGVPTTLGQIPKIYNFYLVIASLAQNLVFPTVKYSGRKFLKKSKIGVKMDLCKIGLSFEHILMV